MTRSVDLNANGDHPWVAQRVGGHQYLPSHLSPWSIDGHTPASTSQSFGDNPKDASLGLQ